MRPKLICSLAGAVLTLVISCSKPSDTGMPIMPIPAPPPTAIPVHPAGDSLFLWQELGDTTFPGGGIIDIWFVSPSKGVYAGLDKNIYQSTDSGRTWSIVPNSASSGMQSFFFLNDQFGFAVGLSQLQITRDGGNTWSLKTIPNAFCLNVFFTNPSTGFYSDANGGVFKTTDTGNTWTSVYHPVHKAQGYYTYFQNDNEGFVFSEDGKFAKTSDAGSDWQVLAQTSAINPNPADPNYNTLQFLDSLNGYYSSEFGLLRTTNGGVSWDNIYPVGGFIAIVKFFDIHTGYLLQDSIIYKTLDGGQSWTKSCKLTKDIFYGMHFINPSTGWVCTRKGYIFRINQ